MTLTRCIAVPRQGERSYTKKSKIRGPNRSRDEGKERRRMSGRVVWGKDGKLANWVIPRPNSSSCSLAKRRKKYYFAPIGVPFCLLPSPSAVCSPLSLLRFPLSLIESSNFRLHSPSACLLCRPVRIQKTLCRNLGTKTRWRVHCPGAGKAIEKEKQIQRKGKNEESKQNAKSSYFYRDWKKSSLQKDERYCYREKI